MVVKSADYLLSLSKRMLMAAGADERSATRAAEALVSSSLCGVDTHGIQHLPSNVTWVQTGEIVGTAWPEITMETPSSALVKGNWTFGHVTAKVATDTAIAKAEQQGIAIVGAVELNHVGRLGEYAEMAAAKGMVALISAGGFSEKAPAAVPYGGRKRLLHTNPIAMGFPAGKETPMIIDFATTAVAGVKIEFARDRNQQLPPNSIVDKDGNPTTDPNAFYNGGGHVPFGGHKGYALMLAVEFMGRIVSGSDAYAQEPFGGPVFGSSGLTAIVFRADLFRPFEAYAQSADEMEQRTRAVPPAPNFERVMIPGDLEAKTRAARLKEGIPIPDYIWQKISEQAAELKVEA